MGSGFILGPAKGLTEVATEKVDIGRVPPAPVNCGVIPSPPNIFIFVITVFRGAFGIIP